MWKNEIKAIRAFESVFFRKVIYWLTNVIDVFQWAREGCRDRPPSLKASARQVDGGQLPGGLKS